MKGTRAELSKKSTTWPEKIACRRLHVQIPHCFSAIALVTTCNRWSCFVKPRAWIEKNIPRGGDRKSKSLTMTLIAPCLLARGELLKQLVAVESFFAVFLARVGEQTLPVSTCNE